MSGAATIELPPWARVSEQRRAHIERVVALLDEWAAAMRVPSEERELWRAAGRLHDSLRDASERELRALLPDASLPVSLLHGPAAAVMLERAGERREAVLSAIRWHTVGCAHWTRTGQALFLADYLEPGRRFARAERTFLAAQVPHDFDGVLAQVVRLRIEATLRDGHPLQPMTVELWNSLCRGNPSGNLSGG